jgi:tight adherence protein B
MSSAVEAVVILLCVVAVVYLSADLLRGRMRERNEREILDRLAPDAPTTIITPVEPGLVERKLRAAGLKGPAEAYVFAVSLFAALVSVVLLRFLPALPLVALIGFAFALYLPWTAINEWGKHRARNFERLLIEAIDLMSGALFAGSNLTQALRSAGSVAEEPVRGAFHEIDRRLTLGMPLHRAMGHMVESFDGEGVRLFTQTLAAKSQAGGDLAPVLRSLNETLRDRWRQQRQVQAQLAGARVSAIAVAALPYAFAPILVWMRPDWFKTLIDHPLGAPLLFFAVLLQLIGMVWLWRILSREL